MSEEKKKEHGNLTFYIIGAILLAIMFAVILPMILDRQQSLSVFEGVAVGGEVFLRALMMMVVPLVVASVMNGILGLGDVRKLGRPGATAVGYYLVTTILAVVIGLCVVNIFQPGSNTEPPAPAATATAAGQQAGGNSQDQQAPKTPRNVIITPEEKGDILAKLEVQLGISQQKLAKIFPELEAGLPGEEPGIGKILGNLVLMLFADNLLEAGATMNLLPLIVFAIVFAGMLTTMGERVSAIKEMVEQINQALMSFVLLLMKVAPLGIFCLIASNFGSAMAEGRFVEMLQTSGVFVVTVLVGLSFHALVTLSLIYYLFTKKNPYRFMKQMSEALLTAFSTASSSATLPVTMECANAAGVSKKSTNFVLPLGATINMDGTALYEAAAAIFIANVFGQDLTFMDQVVIALTATLAAIGAAGIPEAGLVTMMVVLNAVDLPVEGIASVLAVDWLLDRFRTATNTLGDAMGAAIVDMQFKKGDAEIQQSSPVPVGPTP